MQWRIEMSKFRFDIKARQARSAFNEMAKRIGEIGVDHAKNVVIPSESFDGDPWAPPKKPQDHKLLDKTGKLRSSIHVVRANSKGVKWGAGVPYAVYHNDGTDKIPKRQFIGMDKQLASKIKKVVQETMKNIL